ncbi:hypothetical protein J4218_02175 [Candidatus Pacearchaeota archaeon]|nr:hypothetical protein [uncultured archaeon]AQS29161.1 hypothetical protein [uncultured archaeon]MBS3078905.1 hypothetical protein [Candidatus Pacearchaeota archaeon]
MVYSVGSVEDLLKELSRAREPIDYRLKELEQGFIDRRTMVEKMFFDKTYLDEYTTVGRLHDLMLTINGLSIESSRFDDEYRALAHQNISNPNYEQLQFMLRGARQIVQRKIRYRQNQST